MTNVCLGDVRIVCGVEGLVLKRLDGGWLCCPVKQIQDVNTGKIILVHTIDGGVLAAMPELSEFVDDKDVGRIIYRVFPHQTHKASQGWRQLVEGTAKCQFDMENPYSEHDFILMRSLCGSFLREGDT